jgi:hypothetical protein
MGYDGALCEARLEPLRTHYRTHKLIHWRRQDAASLPPVRAKPEMGGRGGHEPPEHASCRVAGHLIYLEKKEIRGNRLACARTPHVRGNFRFASRARRDRAVRMNSDPPGPPGRSSHGVPDRFHRSQQWGHGQSTDVERSDRVAVTTLDARPELRVFGGIVERFVGCVGGGRGPCRLLQGRRPR